MPKSELTARCTNTVDYSKIQKLLQEAQVKVLVGFPSGRMHVATKHTKKKGKRYTASIQSERETAVLASDLHFGTAHIPARPFLFDGITKNKKEIVKVMKTEMGKKVKGGKTNWEKIASFTVGKIQEFVRSDFYKKHVPNSDETIVRKGSDTPLIDGGDLMGNLSFIVEKK